MTTVVDGGNDGGRSGPAVFGLVVTPMSVKAGDVTFVVNNAGKMDHEVIVLKTDTAFDHLPVVDGGDPPAPVAKCAGPSGVRSFFAN